MRTLMEAIKDRIKEREAERRAAVLDYDDQERKREERERKVSDEFALWIGERFNLSVDGLCVYAAEVFEPLPKKLGRYRCGLRWHWNDIRKVQLAVRAEWSWQDGFQLPDIPLDASAWLATDHLGNRRGFANLIDALLYADGERAFGSEHPQQDEV